MNALTFSRIAPAVCWLVLGALIASFLVTRCDPGPPLTPSMVRVDTVEAEHWRQRSIEPARQVDPAAGRFEQLKRTLEGIQARGPTTLTVYDTIIDVRTDTVILALSVDESGTLTLDTAVPDSHGLHRPQTGRGAQLGDCDEGWAIRGTQVICDRARLGHLRLLARAGLRSDITTPAPLPTLAIGARWTPSYRSRWAIEARVTEQLAGELTIERHFQIW